MATNTTAITLKENCAKGRTICTVALTELCPLLWSLHHCLFLAAQSHCGGGGEL